MLTRLDMDLGCMGGGEKCIWYGVYMCHGDAKACCTIMPVLISIGSYLNMKASLTHCAKDGPVDAAAKAAQLAVGRMSYGNKKMRIDEDVKKAATVSLLTECQIRTAADFVRCTGAAASTASARGWELDHITRSQAAAVCAFQGWRYIRIALDGSRIGKPAEETYVYWLLEGPTKLFFPLAPQVFNH